MKTVKIILIILLVLFVLLGVGLQIFLTKGLTTALNQGVFPAVKSMYGLDMSITGASVNLLRGSADLSGFKVRNLKEYEEPYLFSVDQCRFDVEMFSLIKRDPIVIRKVEASGATLVIERNKAKKYNVVELAQALKPVESKEKAPPEKPSEPQQPPAEEPAAVPMKPIPLQVRQIAVSTFVKYVDSGRDMTYEFSLRFTGSDIFTIPADDQKASLFVLRGSLAHKTDSFVTDLNAMVEPLTDPKNASFKATGSILDIDAEFLSKFLKKNQMESRSFSIKPSITCAQGDLQGSRIDVVLNDLKVVGVQIGDTTLKMPLSGTLQRPVLNLTGALQSIYSEQAMKIGKTLGQRELQKQLGVGTNTSAGAMLTSGLSNNVKEVADSPALQELISQVASGSQSTNSAVTNKPLGDAVGDALTEQVDKNVKELKGNEDVKKTIKGLSNALFGE